MKKLLLAASATMLMSCACVARGSRVLTPTGWRNVEDLEVGDPVFAVDEASGELHATTVTAVRKATREVGSVRFGETTLRMTSDHPVYCPVEQAYAPAGDWFLGKRSVLAILSDDRLLATAVEDAVAYVGVSDVFDITVGHDLHNFIAEGVVVHNKQRICDDGRKSGYLCECEDGSTGEYICVEDGSECSICGSAPEPDAGADMMTADASSADASMVDAASDMDASNMDASDMDASAADAND